jgi:hypothetical protein
VTDSTAVEPVPPPPVYRRRLPTRALIADRRVKALQLRAAALSHEEIGLRLHVDPDVNSTGTGFVGGYGWLCFHQGRTPLIGQRLSTAVSQDIRKALAEHRRLSEEAADLHVQLELDRLDKLQAAIWQRCLTGDLWAVDRALMISQRRAKLLGIDIDRAVVDAKTEVNVTVEGAQPVLNAEYLAQVKATIEAVGGTLGPADDIVDAEVVDDADTGRVAVPQP